MSTPRSLRLVAEESVLVLVDYQERLMPAIHADAAVRQRARLLAHAAETLEVPILGTEQNPDKLGPLVDCFPDLCARVLPKMHFGASEDGLLEAIDELAPQARQVVVAGCETHVCLLQTALGLLEAGRSVWVVDDACGSRDQRDHDTALSRLAHAGATIVSTEMVAFEWTHTSEHPSFKAISRLVKEPRF